MVVGAKRGRGRGIQSSSSLRKQRSAGVQELWNRSGTSGPFVRWLGFSPSTSMRTGQGARGWVGGKAGVDARKRMYGGGGWGDEASPTGDGPKRDSVVVTRR